EIDWSPLMGKRAILCMDNDAPLESGPKSGSRPGPEAAWRIVDQLTALNIPALLVDQDPWGEINDLNDYLIEKGPTDTRIALEKLEQWLIPGLPGSDAGDARRGRPRIFLPPH